jgi:hypothetical protein
VKDVFVQSGFDGLNYNIYKILYPMEGKRFIVDSALGLKIQSLIAFAYTYHYLNWFSKTSIIKWHQVSKLKLSITVLMWIGSVGLYLYNYRVGLLTLFFVSMIHVFLEFPLNIRSITGIGEELKKIYSPSSGKYST